MDNGASSYRRFLEGDDNGIVEIIRDYKDGLILFLNRYINNIHIAEELAEDTFFRLVTRKPRFVSNHSFKTWLFITITILH
jgi:RNA polymerase sigma-70 factor (ECF subfamily)